LPVTDGIQAAADRLGITRATARTHLQSVFDKTGAHRQAGLVRLVLKLGMGAMPGGVPQAQS
jgi:DNA-binding NarL/FixJ family response regulator